MLSAVGRKSTSNAVSVLLLYVLFLHHMCFSIVLLVTLRKFIAVKLKRWIGDAHKWNTEAAGDFCNMKCTLNTKIVIQYLVWHRQHASVRSSDALAALLAKVLFNLNPHHERLTLAPVLCFGLAAIRCALCHCTHG
jgi:hypothetical protein